MPLKHSSCRQHSDPYDSRSNSRHRHRHESRSNSRHGHRYDWRSRSRSNSRHRRHSDAHAVSCEYCNEDICHGDCTARIQHAARSLDWSHHDHDSRGHYSSRTRPKYEAHKPSQATEQDLRVQLFEAKKKEKRYEEATQVYRDALCRDKDRGSSDKMLKLQASFADMQVNQGNCHEAERLLDDILKWKDLPAGIKTQCSGIEGQILCARKRYTEAENLYRKLYDRASKDEASLAFGDEMCNAIAQQGDLDRAHIEQATLVEKRKKNLGTGHSTTVKSANKAVANIRKLILKLSKDSNADRQRTPKRKQALESDIEYLIRDIWESLRGNIRNLDSEALKIGHELGLSLSNQSKFDQAERVLNEVWEGRKEKLGETNKDTLSSGICLGQAMYRQALDGPSSSQDMGSTICPQQLALTRYRQGSSTQPYSLDGATKCNDAAVILYPIWKNASREAYGDKQLIAQAAGAHLGIAFARLGYFQNAEQFLRGSAHPSTTDTGAPMPPSALMEHAQHECMKQYMVQAPKSKSQGSKVGQWGMLPQVMTMGPTRLAIAAQPFNTPHVMGYGTGQGSSNHKSALSRGKKLMENRNYGAAAKVLGSAWEEPTSSERKKEIRAKCGDKYGVCLMKLRAFDESMRVFGMVEAYKRQIGMSSRDIRTTEGLRHRAQNLLA